MRIVLLIGGILAVAGLWGIAAFRIAPAMELEVQREGARFLSGLEFPLQVQADGLLLLISGELPQRTDRFSIRERLQYLHPLVEPRLNLSVRKAPSADPGERQSSIRRWRRTDRDSRESDDSKQSSREAGSSNCELLQRLDPGLACQPDADRNK